MLKSNAHAGEVFFRQANHRLVNVAEHRRLHGGVFYHLSEDTTIAAADHKDTFWIRVGVESKVGDHFLVAEDKKKNEEYQQNFGEG